METAHLQKRRQTWYLKLRVPAHVVPVLGKEFICRSLQTRDLREANKKKHELLAYYQKQFDLIERTAEHETPLSRVVDYSKELAFKQKHNLIDPNTAAELWSIAVDTHLERHNTGMDEETGNYLTDDETATRLHNAGLLVDDPDRVTLSQVREVYLTETAKRVRQQTIDAKRQRINAFLKWLKIDKEPHKVKKKDAGKFLTEYLMIQDLSPKSKKDFISDLSAFFNWMAGRGQIEFNPFQGLSGTIKENSRGSSSDSDRRAWEEPELVRLLSGIKGHKDKRLAAMTLIGLYSGMRSNEIAEALIENTQPDYLFVHEAKNDNSVRVVPLHPIIRELVKALKATSKDGYLIEGLKAGGSDNKRNHYFVKQFGSFKKKLGLTDSGLVFHSLRNTFITCLERVGCASNVIQQIVGHEKQGMSLNGYSAGLLLEQLLPAVEKVTYGERVDRLAMEIAERISS